MEEYIDLARLGASDKAGDTYVAPDQGNKKKKSKDGKKHELPEGAVGWKHGWVPVDSNGNPVKSAPDEKGSNFVKDAEAKHKAAGGKTVEQYGQEKLAKQKQAEANKKTAADNKIRAAKKRAENAKKSEDTKAAKAASDAHKGAVESKLLGSDPSGLSEEGLAAALSAAKQKLADAGYSDQAQGVVDRIKAEIQSRQEADGKAAEAEHVAKHEVASKMVQEGKADTVKKAAVNRAQAEKAKQDSSPEAKRLNVAKQASAPHSAAAATLTNLPAKEKAKLKLKAQMAKKAEASKTKAEHDKLKAGAKETDRLANADTSVKIKSVKDNGVTSQSVTNKKTTPNQHTKVPTLSEYRKSKKSKTVHLSNGVNFTIDLANAPKGQLAFRYKHGWILINPMVPSRGKLGGGLAHKFGVKSGTTTKGFFENSNGKGKKFVPTSTGHPTISQQIKDTKNKLAFDVAQKKEDAALKSEVAQVKVDVAKETYVSARKKAKAATLAAANEPDTGKKAGLHTKAFEAHTEAQTAAANLASLPNHSYMQGTASLHSDMALKHQKLAAHSKLVHEDAVQKAKIDQLNKEAQDAAKATTTLKQKLAETKAKQAAMSQKAQDAAKVSGLKAKDKEQGDALEQQAQEYLAKKKAAEAKKAAKLKFMKVESGVMTGGEKKIIVPGVASPKGKLFVHKTMVGDEPKGKTYTMTSVSSGLKLPGNFKTQKEAKEAAVWTESSFPGKAFTVSGLKDAQTKDPEGYAKWKKEYTEHLSDHNWSGESAPKAPEKKAETPKPKFEPLDETPKPTSEDFKIELPGPGMYADGNAITAAIKAFSAADSKGAPAAEIDARLAAIADAKAAFKAKHGTDFVANKVESGAAKSPFTPQLGGGEFFDKAKEAGYYHPDVNEDVTNGWNPPKGTRTAIKAYTGSNYSMINSQLRKYGTTGGSADKQIEAMDKAFASAPGLEKPMVSVRKMKSDGQFPSFPPPMDAGSEYIDYGYGSTSKSTNAWSGHVVMEVRMPAGTKVLDVNHNNVVGASASEQEILLARGAKYRVVSDSQSGGQRNIVVEVVSTGHVKGQE